MPEEKLLSRPAVPWLDILSEWLLYVSAALIVSGVLMPSFYTPGWMGWIGNQEMNVIDLIDSLYQAREWVLVGVVVVFSILFPLAKTLAGAVFFRFGNKASKRVAFWMQFLGKWSMLDVFLAALLIALTKSASQFDLEPRLGLYLFASGVILNNIATMRLSLARAS